MIGPAGIPGAQRLPMMSPIPREERDEEDWQFFAEAIQSWRAWTVVDWDGIITLRSVTYKTKWIPRQELIAECLSMGISATVPRTATRHASPDLDHGCGIYSLKDSDDAKKWVNHPPPTSMVVYGKVSIWGHCYAFSKGYLSEFAYPAFLIVPTWRKKPEEGKKMDIDIHPQELAQELSNTYRVEAVTE